jgi:hypothetical protein
MKSLRIHEKRLEIISELAGKITGFHERVQAYTAPWESVGGPSKEERRQLAADAFPDFNKYFAANYCKIDAFRIGLYKISTDFLLLRRARTPIQDRPHEGNRGYFPHSATTAGDTNATSPEPLGSSGGTVFSLPLGTGGAF